MTASAGSDSFRLKWDDFQENLVNHLKGSKGDADFSDVTLVCEDGRQFEAHRMILAAGSGFFTIHLHQTPGYLMGHPTGAVTRVSLCHAIH